MSIMIINSEYKYSETTGRIIGAAMEVHRILGTGFQEVVYQRALAEEFSIRQIDFKREVSMDIYYKERFIGNRRVDFLIEDKISLELKALTKLEDVHIAQSHKLFRGL